MKNRAKCKLCNTIIESFHDQDDVHCKCGHIFVYGGNSMKCGAIDWANFIRIDDLGNEIIPKIVNDINSNETHLSKPGKGELLTMFNEMIKNIENLPQHAATEPITHYDFASALLLVYSLFKALDDS